MRPYSLNLEIAGIAIKMESQGKDWHDLLLSKYGQYLSFSKKAEVVLVIKEPRSAREFSKEEFLKNGVRVVFKKGKLYWLKNKEQIAFFDTCRNVGEVNLLVGNFLCFDNFLKIVMAILLVAQNGFLIHASSVLVKKRVLAFLGPSGIGKSTIMKLTGRQYFSDDSLIVRRQKGVFWSFSSPFYEKTRIKRERLRVPLGALFFLHQSKTDSLEKLSAKKAFLKLMDNFRVVFYDRKALTKIFSLVAEVVEMVPCFDLYFTKSNSFRRFLEDEKFF